MWTADGSTFCADAEVRVLRQSPAAEDVLVRVQAPVVARNSVRATCTIQPNARVSAPHEREVAALTPTDVGATSVKGLLASAQLFDSMTFHDLQIRFFFVSAPSLCPKLTSRSLVRGSCFHRVCV